MPFWTEMGTVKPVKACQEGTDTRTFLLWQPSAEPLAFANRCLTPMTLTGADLLARVKELGDASKSDLVHACGYVSTKKDGSERLNFTAFYVGEAFSKSGAPGGQRREPGQ